jgi:hypothetical protein
MATFDTNRGEIVFRVVYDGLATAGKSTNIAPLHALESERERESKPRSHPRSPAAGRSSSIGSSSRRATSTIGLCACRSCPSRARSCSRSDACACSATRTRSCSCATHPNRAQGCSTSRGSWHQLLKRHANCANVPVILQANKQDEPDALSAAQIRARLGAAVDDVELVEASAQRRQRPRDLRRRAPSRPRAPARPPRARACLVAERRATDDRAPARANRRRRALRRHHPHRRRNPPARRSGAVVQLTAPDHDRRPRARPPASPDHDRRRAARCPQTRDHDRYKHPRWPLSCDHDRSLSVRDPLGRDHDRARTPARPRPPKKSSPARNPSFSPLNTAPRAHSPLLVLARSSP